MKLKHLSETSDFIVIEKPIGLSVHNDNTKEVSVVSLMGGKVLPVHRLDKETSGVLLVAKNKTAAAHLSGLFQSHEVRKIYHALLRGPLKKETLSWTKPLTDKAEGRRNPQGLSQDRVPSKTQGRVLKTNDYFTFVELELLTGRQHQIRKHAAIDLHPIIGDPRYNDPKHNEMILKRYHVERMFLHATSLEFHWNEKKYKYESSLPSDFKKLLG